MKKFLKIVAGIFLFAVICLVVFVIVKVVEVNKGKIQAEQEYKDKQISAFKNFGTVKNLSIIPLIDYIAVKPGLKTEAGVSYLIRADNTVMLMDTGFNQYSAHHSPLMQNMEKLGVQIKDFNILFFSHMHLDHVGGMNEMRKQTFNLTHGPLDLRKITVYAPEEMKQSEMTPVGKIITNQDPFILRPGIGSIGAIPRHLFLMGKVYEESLAINVQGKGIVLIVGCGHQGIDKIVERTRALFKEPIYAIIGGLHYPVHGGRSALGPVDVQYIVGTDAPPWQGLQEADVFSAIEVIKKTNAQIVALSPHDSSDWALNQFKEKLGKQARDLQVGLEIKI